MFVAGLPKQSGYELLTACAHAMHVFDSQLVALDDQIPFCELFDGHLGRFLESLPERLNKQFDWPLFAFMTSMKNGGAKNSRTFRARASFHSAAAIDDRSASIVVMVLVLPYIDIDRLNQSI